jgi:hypothetical protein
MGLFGRRDWREERTEANKTNKDWQEELEKKNLSSNERSIQTNKNYKAHIGQSAQEIKSSRDPNTDNDTRDSFTTEELERQTRLERKQIENIQDTSTKKETF